MAHFALVEHGLVTQVIVATPLHIMGLNNSEDWIQTSYNTSGGQHPQGKPMRKNYAGVGYTYDRVRDAFIAPQPFASWILTEDTCLWNAPIPMPTDGTPYTWDESLGTWIVSRSVTE